MPPPTPIRLPECLNGSRHVWLSPHPDDAALSAGALIARQASAGEHPVILSACTAGNEVASLTEDRAAWAHLGCVGAWLDEPLAATRGMSSGASRSRWTGLRRRLSAAWLALAGHYDIPAPADPLPERLAAVLAAAVCAAAQDAVFYAPLGVGNHPDHVAAFRAALALARLGVPVRWYEDTPYACVARATNARLADIALPLVPCIEPADAQWDRKIAAVASYQSQLPAIFGTADRFEAVLAAYARGIGGGRPAERLWVLPPSA